jgi:5-methyltetrahydropteroyltriglutamate--homocysteine methyltransferase
MRRHEPGQPAIPSRPRRQPPAAAGALPSDYAALIDSVIDSRPKDLTVAVHLCRGNFMSAWVAEEALMTRITEAAKFMPLEQMCLSPQCGFSSTVDGNQISQEEQWAKVRRIVDVSREVWGD